MLSQVTQSDIDEFRAGIEPLANAGRLGALLAQFPASFKNDARSRDYLASLLRAFGDYPTAVELRHKSWSDAIGDTLALLNGFGRGLGADRRAEVQILDSAELSAQRDELLLHAPARTERRAVVAARQERGSIQLPVLSERAEGVLGDRGRGKDAGEEVVSLHEQPLLIEVGRQRGDAEGAARRADRGGVPAGARRALSRTGRIS